MDGLKKPSVCDILYLSVGKSMRLNPSPFLLGYSFRLFSLLTCDRCSVISLDILTCDNCRIFFQNANNLI